MDINSIVNASVTVESQGVDRASFGLAMAVGYHDHWADLHRIYNTSNVLSALVTEGFDVNSPIYKTVESFISNDPKPPQIAVGRRLNGFVQTVEIEVDAVPAEGTVIEFFAVDSLGVATPINHTVLSADTVTEIAAGLAADLNAITNAGATSALGVITFTANANIAFTFPGVYKPYLSFEDTTAATDLAADLAAINVDFNKFYLLLPADPTSVATAAVVDTFISAQEKIAGLTARDVATITAINASFRTYALYSRDWNKRAAASWAGECLPFDPGFQTWAFKTLPGVQPDDLTANMISIIEAAGGNVYVTVGGVNMTWEGKTGGGEFIDIIRFRDWILARIRESVFGALVRVRKIPFTDGGVQLIVAPVEGVLSDGITAGGLSDDPAPIVTAPLVSAVSSANKIDRLLPDIKFKATVAGAIHAGNINGIISI